MTANDLVARPSLLESPQDSVSSVPQLYPQLEELLFPLISRMMSEEGADVLEEARRGYPPR